MRLRLEFIREFFWRFQALSLIGDRRNKEAAERLEKEKELQKVSVKKDDIELIVSNMNLIVNLKCNLTIFGAITLMLIILQVKEMEISRVTAERTLREHCGDVVAALITLTN